MFVPGDRNPIVRWLESLAGSLTSVVFPMGCRLCDASLTHAGRLPICEPCLASFQAILPPICSLCGQTLQVAAESGDAVTLCHECTQGKFAFQAARSFGVYEAALAHAIILLKYERLEPLGSYLAMQLLQLVRCDPQLSPVDVLVPVPLHRQKHKERGFNQVDLFAHPLARRLHLPYRPVLLMRSRPRPEKHLLTQEERWETVRGAFVLRQGGRVDNLRVLLLDDVMTTGATLDACARALREAGARTVVGLTVARAVRPVSPVSGE